MSGGLTPVVVAPDSFKGCLSSVRVAATLAAGLREAWPAAAIVAHPMADGGEGTLAAIAARVPGAEVTVPALGPHGEALQAGWWLAADGRLAVVEVARAAGLSVTRRREPLRASSFGAGQLIAAALDSGAREVQVAAGGSATVDGGAGILTALGFELVDAAGTPLPPGGAALVDLAEIRPPTRQPWRDVSLAVLCDVTNPFIGPAGAARVFGPQKGADPAAVERLEIGLARLAEVLSATFGRDPRDLPGAGAAGGLAGGLWAALGAELRGGFDAIAALTGLDASLEGAALVVTGEGRVDGQTRYGKTADGVIRRAEARGLPVWVFAGEVTAEAEAWAAGRAALVPVADGPRTLADSVEAAPALLRRAAARAARLWSSGR